MAATRAEQQQTAAPAALAHLDVRVLQSVPTPAADCLLAKGCSTAGQLLQRRDILLAALSQFHVVDPERRASAILNQCEREVSSARPSALSALDLLGQARGRPPLKLPCRRLGGLLEGALAPGPSLLEVCGLPGTGKTQISMQICACSQCEALAEGRVAEAIYIDTEGSFVPRRYGQMCEALFPARSALGGVAEMREAVLRGMHVSRVHDASQLVATIRRLDGFLRERPGVKVVVVDSVAFCFRHDADGGLNQRSLVLQDIATALRRCGADRGVIVVVTNHMTVRFDRGDSSENKVGWLAPALGEVWEHQAGTQMRLERPEFRGGHCQPGRSVVRATITKSVAKASLLNSCLYRIDGSGVRDAEDEPEAIITEP